MTQEYRVDGPVMIFSTTTAIEIDEELLNRCLVLASMRAASRPGRSTSCSASERTLDGLLVKRAQDPVFGQHQNAQRLLRPLDVLKPLRRCAHVPPDKTHAARRDHEKYLTLIDTIALLHQYQREYEPRTRTARRSSTSR